MSDSQAPVVLITGSTDGLGREVARRLASQGWEVLLHGRNPAKGESVQEELRAATYNEKVRYYNADLASLQETASLAERVLSDEPRLNVLVNNAGIGPKAPDSPRQESPDGHELLFAVNYLSGYLLTHRLLPLLRKSKPARIVNVSSIGQQTIDFDDVMIHSGYDDARAYRQSKLAQILFTFDLAEHLKGRGITVNCLHPATLMNTNMVLNSDYFAGAMSSLEEGADALERLVTAPELADVTGAYFDVQKTSTAKDQAYDPEARRKLRELSDTLTGL